jgi:hypothetical protein
MEKIMEWDLFVSIGTKSNNGETDLYDHILENIEKVDDSVAASLILDCVDLTEVKENVEFFKAVVSHIETIALDGFGDKLRFEMLKQLLEEANNE